MIQETILKTIADYGMLEKKEKILLGISGGPDSIFLLYFFAGLAEEYKLRLVCAHFNHHLREEADDEEEFVKKLCVQLGIRCISAGKDVKSFFDGDSLEQTARNLRYDFFLNCCRSEKIKKLALAHHKDDLVETVLMRIIRGAGLRGLRGFLPKSRYRGLTVIRPLVELRKAEILEWLKKQKISYCLDKSNLDEKFLRNKIRHKLIPLLEEMNPNISNGLFNLAISAGQDYDFIYSYSQKEFAALRRRTSRREIGLDIEGLKKLLPAIFNNVIRIAIEELKGNTRKIDNRHLEEIRKLISHRPSGSLVDLPDFLAKKEDGLLVLQSCVM
jgi:tRNA(Ile)-lysidine synthase